MICSASGTRGAASLRPVAPVERHQFHCVLKGQRRRADTTQQDALRGFDLRRQFPEARGLRQASQPIQHPQVFQLLARLRGPLGNLLDDIRGRGDDLVGKGWGKWAIATIQHQQRLQFLPAGWRAFQLIEDRAHTLGFTSVEVLRLQPYSDPRDHPLILYHDIQLQSR